MRILVTGGAGFIGSHVVDLLLNKGHEVSVIDNLTTGLRSNVPAGVRFYKMNIGSRHVEFVFLIENPDIVIHLAAQVNIAKSLQNPESDAQTNLMDSISLFMLCQKYGVKKIIYSSSCAIYGDTNLQGVCITESDPIQPINFYGISKFAPELYLKAFHQLYGISYTILRYANVYGPRQNPNGEGGVVTIFINKLLNGKQPEIFGDGSQTRDFVYVKDVAAANVLAIDLEKGTNSIFNIGSNTRTNINQLYRMITASLTTDLAPVYLPQRKGDIQDSCLDNRKAFVALHWKPEFDLERGLRETVKYYLEQGTLNIQSIGSRPGERS